MAIAGLGIIIPRPGYGPAVPDVDARLHDGSLFLLDVMHSSQPIAAGVPADGSLIANIANEHAAALIGGSPSESDLSGIFKSNNLNGATGLLERTGKGGIHAIVTQSALAAGAGGAAILLPAVLRQYLLDHPTNDIYMSQWTDRTRASLITSGTSNFKFAISSTASSLANYKAGHISYGSGINSSRPNVGVNYLGARAALGGGNEIGPQLANVASSGWTGTAPSTLATLAAYGFNVGSPGTTPITSRQASGFSSEVFYACYVEDLTVSGRAYAEVDAIDVAAFNAAFGAGGRYNSDTYTAPSIVA